MATNAPWSIFGGMNKKLLKHVFALYSLPMIFSKNFLARYARSIAFYPQLTNASMQCVLPTLFIYFFYLLVSLSLTASFQSSLKTRTKLRIKCPKTVCGGGMGGGGEWGVAVKGGRRENGGNSAMVACCGGIDAPALNPVVCRLPLVDMHRLIVRINFLVHFISLSCNPNPYFVDSTPCTPVGLSFSPHITRIIDPSSRRSFVPWLKRIYLVDPHTSFPLCSKLPDYLTVFPARLSTFVLCSCLFRSA